VQRYSFDRIARAAKIRLHGRPRCLPLVISLVREKSGIEIGGPSTVFRNWYNIPIYDRIAVLDNCDFSQSTTWATHEERYQFSKRRSPGFAYFCEGSDLHSVHNLEHFANPVRALKEWQRVVKSGGHIVLVLPHYAMTFDCRRSVTSVNHMLEDYERQVGEDDLTHLDEIIETRSLGEGSGSDEEARAILQNNFSHRMMHHHTFDELNSRKLLETMGMRVLAVETVLPFHITLVAQNLK
jgi:SAM-dependent methyltransferase